MVALEVKDLAMYARSTPLLRDISFDIGSGRIALLGANGSGKSTLLKILAGVDRPSFGSVKWSVRDGVQQPKISMMPQAAELPRRVKALDFLMYGCFVMGCRGDHVERCRAAMARVGMAAHEQTPCGSLSGGEQRRLLFAWAGLGDPDVLILDEPTAGVDANARGELRRVVGESPAGITMFSTHFVGDVIACADQVLILEAGELLRVGPVSEVLAGIDRKSVHYAEEAIATLASGIDSSRHI